MNSYGFFFANTHTYTHTQETMKCLHFCYKIWKEMKKLRNMVCLAQGRVFNHIVGAFVVCVPISYHCLVIKYTSTLTLCFEEPRDCYFYACGNSLRNMWFLILSGHQADDALPFTKSLEKVYYVFPLIMSIFRIVFFFIVLARRVCLHRAAEQFAGSVKYV